jgi:hypothetical protein
MAFKGTGTPVCEEAGIAIMLPRRYLGGKVRRAAFGSEILTMLPRATFFGPGERRKWETDKRRLDKHPERMRLWRETVEPSFGTI